MRRDILNDLYGDRHMLDDLGRMFRDEDMLISGTMREAPWNVLQDSRTEEDGGPLPLTECLAQAAEGRNARVFGESSINTYPFGEPTEQVFPEFLGICSGDAKLDGVLRAARVHCERVRQSLPKDLPKTVMVFTDKWDWPTFHRKFEFPFLRYALENNVLFIFLLVTDYGVSRIPFLARNHRELDGIRRRGYDIESCPGIAPSAESGGRNVAVLEKHDTGARVYEPKRVQNQLNGYLEHLRRYDPFILERRNAAQKPFSSLEPGEIRYEFILRQRCCVVREGTQTPHTKRIPPDVAKEFARVLMRVEEEYRFGLPYYYGGSAGNSDYCAAELFGERLIWDPAALDVLPQAVREVVDALEKLSLSLKEMR